MSGCPLDVVQSKQVDRCNTPIEGRNGISSVRFSRCRTVLEEDAVKCQEVPTTKRTWSRTLELAMVSTKGVSSITIGGFTFMMLSGCSTTDQQIAQSLVMGLAGVAAQYEHTSNRPRPIKVQPTPVYQPVSTTPSTGTGGYTGGGGGYVGGGGCGVPCSGSCGIR